MIKRISQQLLTESTNLSTWLTESLKMINRISQQLLTESLNLSTITEALNSQWEKIHFVQLGTGLKLNTKIGLHTTTTTTTTNHPPPPTTQTLRQQYLRCYWPDLDQTSNKGSWEHIQQITTVTTTFVKATYVHISNISAVTGPIWIKL